MNNTPQNDQLTLKEIVSDLLGTVCRTCGGSKRARMSHCLGCFMRLPKSMRDALYRRIGQGYEQAYRESNTFLARKG